MANNNPTESDIVLNSHVDTLYTHAFRPGSDGEGRFFNVVTLDDGSQKIEGELTPRIRISFVFIKEKNEVTGVYISKVRYKKRSGWREDSQEHIRLTPITFGKVVELLKFLSSVDLGGIHERRIKLADDALPRIDAETKKKILTLLAQAEGPAIIEELLRSNILNSRDIVNIGYRKAQLDVFRRLLTEDGFIEQYRDEAHVAQQGTESVWQAFFERNSWVFGYGLSYIWCNNLPDSQLEQVVSGFDFNAAGKRVDALLHTSAHLSQFVLVEVKTPDAALIGRNPRPGVWSPSNVLLDGVAQIQKTVRSFTQRYFEKVQLTDDDGNPVGIDVHNVAPRSYLLIGDLAQFKSERGVNTEKYSSFQLFRSSLKDPEIVTFDELYARAQAIVEHAEWITVPAPAAEPAPQPIADEEDIPF